MKIIFLFNMVESIGSNSIDADGGEPNEANRGGSGDENFINRMERPSNQRPDSSRSGSSPRRA